MKTKRHAKILELIQANCIDTQEELLRRFVQVSFKEAADALHRWLK